MDELKRRVDHLANHGFEEEKRVIEEAEEGPVFTGLLRDGATRRFQNAPQLGTCRLEVVGRPRVEDGLHDGLELGADLSKLLPRTTLCDGAAAPSLRLSHLLSQLLELPHLRGRRVLPRQSNLDQTDSCF
tara:strand:+ start:89 stop:478 length:390 start_codon:yes stop_codon:yes gene_type:complete